MIVYILFFQYNYCMKC